MLFFIGQINSTIPIYYKLAFLLDSNSKGNDKSSSDHTS